MSTILYELPDRYVLDTGEIVIKHIRAVRSIMAGKNLDQQMIIDSDDLQSFLKGSNQKPIPWIEGENEEFPPESTFRWNIPESFLNIDLREFLIEKIETLLEDETRDHVTLNYLERLETELGLIEQLKMENFVRSLIYIIDVYRTNNVVWGVGRGSSVESLVLFLIGVHRIDPILYGIELEHFYRSK